MIDLALFVFSAMQSPELLVKEVHFPVATDQWESSWTDITTFADSQDPETSAIYANWRMVDKQGNNVHRATLLTDAGRVHRRFEGDLSLSGLNGMQLASLQRTPTGSKFWALTSQSSPSIEVWDIATSQLVRVIPPPPPAPGKGDTLLRFIENAGDQNGDGWDDIWIAGATKAIQEPLCGLIDGKTGQAVWLRYLVNDSGDVLPVRSHSPGHPGDLDGDGHGDWVLVNFFVEVGVSFVHEVLAVSGADGGLLWSNPISTFGVPRSWRIADLNQDSVDDVLTLLTTVSNPNNHLQALDGRDGTILWESDMSALEAAISPLIPTGYSSSLVTGLSPDGTTPIVAVAYFVQASGSSNTDTYFAFFDLSNGQYLGQHAAPSSLSPFHPESLGDFRGWEARGQPAGDLDGDGLLEMVDIQVMVSEDRAGVPGSPSAAFTYGFRTLFGDPIVSQGTATTLQLRMPALPTSAFQFLFSSGITRRLDADHWFEDGLPTYFRSDIPLAKSRSSTSLRGMTDGLGSADLVFQVPSSTALSGRTFYCRAAIQDSQHAGRVKTLSTIHSITVR